MACTQLEPVIGCVTRADTSTQSVSIIYRAERSNNVWSIVAERIVDETGADVTLAAGDTLSIGQCETTAASEATITRIVIPDGSLSMVPPGVTDYAVLPLSGGTLTIDGTAYPVDVGDEWSGNGEATLTNSVMISVSGNDAILKYTTVV